MPIYKDKDFDKMAEEIVSRYLTGGTKLADAAAQMAMQQNMNPDQVQQMIQAANTLTFLKLMEQAKQQQGGDLTQEFDPINHQDVLSAMLHGQESGPGAGQAPMPGMEGMGGGMGGMEGLDPSMLHGMGHNEDLEQPMGDESMMPHGDAAADDDIDTEEDAGPFAYAGKKKPGKSDKSDKPDKGKDKAKGEKLKGGLADGKPDKAFDAKQLAKGKKDEKEEHTNDEGAAEEIAKDHLEKDPQYYKKQEKNQKEAHFLGQRKLGEALQSKRLGLEFAFEEGVVKLAKEFRKLYSPSFAMFEKDAMVLHGNDALPVLNALREQLRLPARTEVDTGKIKIATAMGVVERDRIVDDSPLLDKFETIMNTVKQAMELDKELKNYHG